MGVDMVVDAMPCQGYKANQSINQSINQSSLENTVSGSAPRLWNSLLREAKLRHLSVILLPADKDFLIFNSGRL